MSSELQQVRQLKIIPAKGQKVIRVVKYVRVSTAEQKIKRNSIVAQHEILDDYIAANPHFQLVGTYSDEGVSGGKFMRTELQRLLEDVEKGGIDVILVTKLDRWFRDIALYYRTQEILERNGTSWKTVLEDYDTLTSDGRLKVNIMLSVAQNEIDRTSERIKVVFDSKVRNKQAITGALPKGFKTVPGNGAKMVVKDPVLEPIMMEFIELVENTNSILGSTHAINDKYDIDLSYRSALTFIESPLLYGHYGGVDGYCEAYITKKRYDALQKAKGRNIKHYERDRRTYVFSGMIKCPKCGRIMSGTTRKHKRKSGIVREYKYYHCGHAKVDKDCEFKGLVGENTVERKVYEDVYSQFEELVMETNVHAPTDKPKINKTAIRKEIDRLNNMYRKGRIDEDEYDREYDKLEQKLHQDDAPRRDLSSIKEILDSDFIKLYKTFDEKEKQIFWRSIIDTLDLVGDKVKIKFL